MHGRRGGFNRSRALLEEFGELGPRQDGLGLAQRLHLLVARLLADVKVVEREVAALVEVRVLVLVLLLLVVRGLEVLLRGRLVRLGLRLLARLVRDVAVLLLDRRVRVLHERLVRLLRVALGLDGVRLELLRLGDDLLQHAEDAASTALLLVRLEARRRRRAGRLLLLDERLLLRVDGLEHAERLLEEGLRLTLVRHRLLEVLVLELAVLARALELRLHLGDLRLEGRDGLGQRVDRRREVRNLRLELRDVASLELLRTLVLVDRVGAEILVLDLVLLLLQKRRNHLVNGRLDLGESVEAHRRSDRRKLRVRVLLRRREEHLGSLVALALLLRLQEVERARERVVRVVRAEDGESLAHRLHLLLARLLTLLPLLVRHLARLLKVHEELLVRRKRVARVLQVLLVVRELRIRVRELLRLGVLLLGAGLDLGLLRRLQVLERLLGGHLLLLRRRQVVLERLLHLAQDAEDLARLRGVALLEGRLRVEVVTRRLQERRDRLLLRRRHKRLDERRVLLELVLDRHRNVEERLRRNLRKRVVLAEHRDRRLQRANRLEQILLLGVELSELFPAQSGRLIKRLLVLRDLRLEVLDLGVQARAVRGALLDRGGEVRDAGLRIGDGLRLLLVVRLAPAGNLLVHLLVLLALLLKLRLHVLEKVDHLGDGAVLLVLDQVRSDQGQHEKRQHRGARAWKARARALE